jgi:hypothetical protein
VRLRVIVRCTGLRETTKESGPDGAYVDELSAEHGTNLNFWSGGAIGISLAVPLGTTLLALAAVLNPTGKRPPGRSRVGLASVSNGCRRDGVPGIFVVNTINSQVQSTVSILICMVHAAISTATASRIRSCAAVAPRRA